MYGILNEPTQRESWIIDVKYQNCIKNLMHDKLHHQLFHDIYPWNITVIQAFYTSK
jgi:hypothetical protein